ncbi:MAG: hypothetical protein U1E36_02120 [Rickettsiales bacterium]
MNNNTLSDDQLAALARNPEDLKRLAAQIENAVRSGEIDYRLPQKQPLSLPEINNLIGDAELATAYEGLKGAANSGVLEFGIGKYIRDLKSAPNDSVNTMAAMCIYFEPDEKHELLPPRSPGMDAYCKAAVAESERRSK